MGRDLTGSAGTTSDEEAPELDDGGEQQSAEPPSMPSEESAALLTLRLIDGVARRLVDGHHDPARARSRRAMAITRLHGPRRWAMAISGARGRSTRDGHRVG